MVYVMSDIHGCYDKYMQMLEKLQPGEDDTLYILGDMVDRGPDGIKILIDLLTRKNVVVLRGNHEQSAAVLLYNFIMKNDPSSRQIAKDVWDEWISDGGDTTYAAFMKLSDEERRIIIRYMGTLPLYKEIEVGGRRFFMAHTVPEKELMLEMEKCEQEVFLMGEPDYDKVYFNDKIIVTGHTPTNIIDPGYAGRIWKGNDHIAVDCGAYFFGRLGCICLDTMEEFYV